MPDPLVPNPSAAADDQTHDATAGALAFAARLVAQCGEVAVGRQAGVHELAKAAPSLLSSVVTEVDLLLERRIDAALLQTFPSDGLVGEEEVDRPSSGGRTWVVDPIDGTLNYARRLGPWSVVLSAWNGDTPLLVAVWTDGVLYTASAGGGCHRDGKRLLLRPESAEAGGIVRVPPHLAAAAAEAGWSVRSTDSSAAELAAVADGRAMGTIRLRGEHRRDLHGPALLVTEAGGVVSSLAGGAWDGATSGLVVAHPGVHQSLLALATAPTR